MTCLARERVKLSVVVDGLLFSLPALLQTRWLSMRRHWSDVRFCLLRFGRVGGYRCAVPGQTCAFIFGASADLATFCAVTELCRAGLVILLRSLGFVVPRNFWAESDFNRSQEFWLGLSH